MQSFKTIDFGLQQNQNCYYFIIICLCCATAQLNDVSLNACKHYECSGNNLFHVTWVFLMSHVLHTQCLFESYKCNE